MFRYIRSLMALLILAGLLIIPVAAQDGPKLPSPPNHPHATGDSVAPIKTFTIFSYSFVEKGEIKFALLVKEDGSAQCIHNESTEKAGFKKTTETTVEANLTPEELKSVREAFAKLDISTLETIPHDDEPERFIGIKATNGTDVGSYHAVIGEYGKFAERVQQFMKVVNKIGDRLK